MDLVKGFDAVKEEYVRYFEEYTFEKPVLFTKDTNDELGKLGLILFKSISHLLQNYKRFLHLMPRSERDLEILEICSRFPCRVGTFRTDFVVDLDNRIRIIEMTTRQPLNGYFTSGFFHEIAVKQAKRLYIKDIADHYTGFFDYFRNYIGDADHICVIKGNEKLEEIKIYPAVFENAGIACHIIPLEELPGKLHLLDHAFAIEELTFNEIRNLPDNIIGKLAGVPLHNNLKSLLYTHDKRTYSLLSRDEFLREVLNAEERELLARYLVPTFVWNEPEDVWEDAFINKDKYILKHQHKGKSVDIYAGSLMETGQWQEFFRSGAVKDYILQPFIRQKKFSGTIGQEVRNDYMAGTMLYFNDHYFGPGLFRTSSHPVTNIQDNRKAAQLVIQTNNRKGDFHYL
jgi:hypothetical protein